MFKFFSYSLLLITLSVFSQITLAERADKDKPIALSSEKASFDDVKQIYILENNVLLIKGTLIIKGEKATVKVDPEGYQFATIFSKPDMQASLKQKRDTGIDEYIQGFGEKIEYDAKTETAILIGKAQMNQLTGTKISDDIHADKIHYDGITEKYHAISSEAVKSMLSPRRKDNQGTTQR